MHGLDGVGSLGSLGHDSCFARDPPTYPGNILVKEKHLE